MSGDPLMAARRAALMVHALGAEDRAWMLAQLPPPQRAALEPLLDELRDLGIPMDRRTLEQNDEATASPAASLARLEGRQMGQLARMLEQEAPEIARALLDAGEPAWRGTLLKQFAPGFAVRVNRLLPRPAGGPALRAALAAAVERRLPQQQANAKGRPRWWPAWVSRRGEA